MMFFTIAEGRHATLTARGAVDATWRVACTGMLHELERMGIRRRYQRVAGTQYSEARVSSGTISRHLRVGGRHKLQGDQLIEPHGPATTPWHGKTTTPKNYKYMNIYIY